MKKILLLGSGELGKEFAIAAKRLGQYVIAVDSYAHAPAQQVSDLFEVINMLDGEALDYIVAKHQPDIIVPEIEAIRTERLYIYEEQGIQVVPSAKAVNFTMNRKAIRDLVAKELGLPTAQYRYADSLETFQEAVKIIGLPCVVKPLMSSSGKGQSVLKTEADIEKAWLEAMTHTRGDIKEVIVEEWIHFESEITLLTITQKKWSTLFCPPIGHRQERGDYQESWMPHIMPIGQFEKAKYMAEKITHALLGVGLWGVEFFLCKEQIYFSELSPRPHDTGMVTLANTLPFNEFELHLRAILGLPIPDLTLQRAGASAVILAEKEGVPDVTGLESALDQTYVDIKIFGKPSMCPNRRMGVALAWDNIYASPMTLVERAKSVAKKVKF